MIFTILTIENVFFVQHEMRLMRKLARHLCAMYKWQETFSQTTSVVRHLQRTQIQLLWILPDFSKRLLPRPATFGFWLCNWVTCANSTTWFAKNGACNPTLQLQIYLLSQGGCPSEWFQEARVRYRPINLFWVEELFGSTTIVCKLFVGHVS